MDQQQLQRLAVQVQDEMNQAVAGFKAKGWEHFKKILVVAGLLAVVGYVGLYRTTASQVAGVKRKVTALREISRYAVEYRDSRTKLEGLRDKFPTEADRKDWLFRLVLTSAKEQGIAIDAISAQKEEDSLSFPFVQLSIIVAAKGTYHQIGSWLAQLEGTGRYTRIESFSLMKRRESDPDTPPSGIGGVTITLATVIPKGMERL